MSTTTEHISTKDTAVLIRQTLTKAFPDVKFSVRTQSYSMGSHVNVGWTDGPAPHQVDAAVGIFCGRTFDGMDDSTHYHDTEWQGRRVSFGGSAPSCQRRVTDYEERKAQSLAMIRSGCVLEGEPGNERFGNDWIDNLASNMVHAADYRQAEPLVAAFRRVVLREREEG